MIIPVREIPRSPDVKATLLGSIILDLACPAPEIERVCVEQFCRHEYSSACETLLPLVQREPGDWFDAILIRDELVRMNGLEGLAALAKLTFCQE